jgi:hypothetical protein
LREGGVRWVSGQWTYINHHMSDSSRPIYPDIWLSDHEAFYSRDSSRYEEKSVISKSFLNF